MLFTIREFLFYYVVYGIGVFINALPVEHRGSTVVYHRSLARYLKSSVTTNKIKGSVFLDLF